MHRCGFYGICNLGGRNGNWTTVDPHEEDGQILKAAPYLFSNCFAPGKTQIDNKWVKCNRYLTNISWAPRPQRKAAALKLHLPQPCGTLICPRFLLLLLCTPASPPPLPPLPLGKRPLHTSPWTTRMMMPRKSPHPRPSAPKKTRRTAAIQTAARHYPPVHHLQAHPPCIPQSLRRSNNGPDCKNQTSLVPPQQKHETRHCIGQIKRPHLPTNLHGGGTLQSSNPAAG